MRRNKKRKLAFILATVLLLGYIYPIAGKAANDTLSKIEVLTQPKIVEYCVGDTFNTKGLSLLVTYSSGLTKILTDNYITDYDFSVSGEKNVTVTYSENGISVCTTFTVNVYASPELRTENASVMQGGTVVIPVSILNNCGLMGMHIKVEYDNTCLVPLFIESTNIFPTGDVNDSVDTSQDNTFNVIWAGTENMNSDGKLFDMVFYCNKDIELDETVVNISAEKDNTYTEKYSPISCVSASGNININTKVNQEKIALKDLAVVIDDWEYGTTAAIPNVSGNLGNGEITYYYATAAEGQYTTQMPIDVGKYYLRVKVAETELYSSGIATCSFKITEPKKEASILQSGTSVTTQAAQHKTETKYEKIKINKPVIKSVKNIKGKKVVIKLKSKVKGASGYEIKYTNKKNSKTAVIISCKGNKLSNTISKLKCKKVYYFSIRTYKKVDGEVYYSGWSPKKKVKVKK